MFASISHRTTLNEMNKSGAHSEMSRLLDLMLKVLKIKVLLQVSHKLHIHESIINDNKVKLI